MIQNNVGLASGHGRFPLLRSNGVGLFCGLALRSKLSLREGVESGAGRVSARGGVDRDLLEFCDKSRVLLRNSAAVGVEASGRSGDGKTGIHIRTASGLDEHGRGAGAGVAGMVEGAREGRLGLKQRWLQMMEAVVLCCVCQPPHRNLATVSLMAFGQIW